MPDAPDKKHSLPASIQFPPVPRWKPAIVQPLDEIIDRVAYYTGGKQDFVVFKHGTCAIVRAGLSEKDAIAEAKGILDRIYRFHPDVLPQQMTDGNILVKYKWPAMNIVLNHVAEEHWEEIDRNHQDALAAFEVLQTNLGTNQFDDFGKKVLFGRCFMFMDAQSPLVVRLVHAAG